MRADGFYDGIEGGRHVWRIRFAPATQGEWRYATVSDLDSFNGIQGAFTCVAPVSRGGLTLSPNFPIGSCAGVESAKAGLLRIGITIDVTAMVC